MDSLPARGSCLCGAVTFDIRLPTKWVAHCHCTRCQRAHGAAFVTWVGVEADHASIDDANGSLRWHVTEQDARRGFCSACGSPMFFKSPRWPGELHLARALFVDPLDRDPQMHVHNESHVEWVSISDNLPRSSE